MTTIGATKRFMPQLTSHYRNTHLRCSIYNLELNYLSIDIRIFLTNVLYEQNAKTDQYSKIPNSYQWYAYGIGSQISFRRMTQKRKFRQAADTRLQPSLPAQGKPLRADKYLPLRKSSLLGSTTFSDKSPSGNLYFPDCTTSEGNLCSEMSNR